MGDRTRATTVVTSGGGGGGGGGGGVCNDTCGCPIPCPAGHACRCKAGGTGEEHKTCPCGEHCSCNPCTCERTEASGTNTTTGAACTCGAGCNCHTCAAKA